VTQRPHHQRALARSVQPILQRGQRRDAQSLAAKSRRLVRPAALSSAHISRPPRLLPEAPYARTRHFTQCLTLLMIVSAALAKFSPHQCRRLVLTALRPSRAVRALFAARRGRQTRETLRPGILALVMPSAIRDSAPTWSWSWSFPSCRPLTASHRRPTMLDRDVRASPASNEMHPCLLPLLVVLGTAHRTPPHFSPWPGQRSRASVP
jgi:hypothetical protein